MKKLTVAVGIMLTFSASGSASLTGLPLGLLRNWPLQTSKPAAGAKLSPDALDKLLGPVALYPDQLLSQILMCSTNPATMATLGEWLNSNQNLKGTALQDAAVKAGFDASYVAIVVFPQVVDMMLGQPDWVRQLGQAFTTDRSNVFASIQRLRGQAQKMGTLKTTPQQEVTTQKTPSGEQVIVIEPANEQVVYVPQYNPQVVYTQPATTTVVVQEDDDSDAAVAAGLIGFTAGIAMGAAMDNDYYYGPYGYRGGFYMYNDAWDDYYDHREDAREDWADHREDLYEERGEQRENLASERTERTEARSETRPQSQAERTERTQTRQTERTERQANRPPETQAQVQAAAQERSAARGASEQARGYSGSQERAKPQRSGTSSGAMSGYSSGKSERAASSRGQSSRSGGGRSGGGGGGRRR